MIHRTKPKRSVWLLALTTILLVIGAPGTNSRFTDTTTGTTRITFSNDPNKFTSSHSEGVRQPTPSPVEPMKAPPLVENSIPTAPEPEAETTEAPIAEPTPTAQVAEEGTSYEQESAE